MWRRAIHARLHLFTSAWTHRTRLCTHKDYTAYIHSFNQPCVISANESESASARVSVVFVGVKANIRSIGEFNIKRHFCCECEFVVLSLPKWLKLGKKHIFAPGDRRCGGNNKVLKIKWKKEREDFANIRRGSRAFKMTSQKSKKGKKENEKESRERNWISDNRQDVAFDTNALAHIRRQIEICCRSAWVNSKSIFNIFCFSHIFFFISHCSSLCCHFFVFRLFSFIRFVFAFHRWLTWNLMWAQASSVASSRFRSSFVRMCLCVCVAIRTCRAFHMSYCCDFLIRFCVSFGTILQNCSSYCCRSYKYFIDYSPSRNDNAEMICKRASYFSIIGYLWIFFFNFFSPFAQCEKIL